MILKTYRNLIIKKYCIRVLFGLKCSFERIMIKGKIKYKYYYFLILIVLLLIILPKAIARFTSNKNVSGNINLTSHPCGNYYGKGAKYIINKEGGVDFINSKAKPDFSKNATSNEGLYVSEDECGKTYYYRGSVNNWVYFAGFYWRIIRINGDGSIRMIYTGTKGKTSGTDAHIMMSIYNQNDDKEVNANYLSSNIKFILEMWYDTNIQNKGYGDRVKDSSFCNELKKEGEYYSAIKRSLVDYKPSFKCSNKEYILNKASGKLLYSVGLITVDEASFAGGTKEANNNYYLYSSYWYWTMSPTYWNGSRMLVGIINSKGFISSDYLSQKNGVRPVINLDTNVDITTGDGTESNPYVIK